MATGRLGTKPSINQVLEMSKRKWCVMDLVTDHATGKLRESSVWSNVGKAAVLWAYLEHISAGSFEMMTLVMGGLLLGHEGVSRILNQRAKNENQPTGN